jgi:hypothetical protein
MAARAGLRVALHAVSPPFKASVRAAAALVLGALIVWAAPLAGLALAGQPVARYLSFPPRTAYVAHTPFSWTAFMLLSLPALLALAAFARAISRAHGKTVAIQRTPWWLWLGVALIAIGWVLAWREGLVAAEWRRHTFTVLWLGYIVVVNALAYRRCGRSPITHDTKVFLWLFGVSGAFWWLFEYLNQFTGNWYYEGVSAPGAWDYFIQGTLPFSTVLPAFASTWAWLAAFPRFDALSLRRVSARRWLAWIAAIAGTLALVALPLAPEQLFAMLWLAPLLVFAGLQFLLTKESLFEPLARGDWRPVLQPAAAGLICGLVWELWNYGSLAKWHYSVPYVQRFPLFEMPLLGYAGYLPFGVECALVVQLVQRLCRG